MNLWVCQSLSAVPGQTEQFAVADGGRVTLRAFAPARSIFSSMSNASQAPRSPPPPASVHLHYGVDYVDSALYSARPVRRLALNSHAGGPGRSALVSADCARFDHQFAGSPGCAWGGSIGPERPCGRAHPQPLPHAGGGNVRTAWHGGVILRPHVLQCRISPAERSGSSPFPSQSLTNRANAFPPSLAHRRTNQNTARGEERSSAAKAHLELASIPKPSSPCT